METLLPLRTTDRDSPLRSMAPQDNQHLDVLIRLMWELGYQCNAAAKTTGKVVSCQSVCVLPKAQPRTSLCPLVCEGSTARSAYPRVATEVRFSGTSVDSTRLGSTW